MKRRRTFRTRLNMLSASFAGSLLAFAGWAGAAEPPAPGGAQPGNVSGVCEPAMLASPYLTVDSWIYPAVLRLFSLGYIDTAYLGVRPWTRSSVVHMLEEAGMRIDEAETNGEPTAIVAKAIYQSLQYELRNEMEGPCGRYYGDARLESAYTIVRAISGTPLHDSYHLGATIVNDYGRSYEKGFNNYSGMSGYASVGRFTFYVRGEFQGMPSAVGYSPRLTQTLATIDKTVNPITGIAYPGQATIPSGSIATAAQGQLLELYAGGKILNHLISFGKEDEWIGPAEGASMAYSNNAQNIYAFHIDRIEPLRVPLLSRITGRFRYQFLVGPLRGHRLMPNPLYPGPNQPNVINPGNPWVHVEKISFKPTTNLELGFERTVLWGGKGHAPVNLHTFLHSFFSTSSPGSGQKLGRDDPGARFASFDVTYRVPFVRNWLTFYADSEVHDDVSPVDAPRRASWRPGLYLSHFPGLPKLDIRTEAAMTDPSISSSQQGGFMYIETIERQGYTNQGQLFGDWIGREDKGGQAWITYHLSGNEWIQLGVRNQKAAKDFIPGGTTLNDENIQIVKRIGKDLEINGNFDLERWNAPVYLPGRQTVTSTTIQLTWYPERKVSF